MEDNLEKQFIPYLEPIINQTLEMIETISEGEDFDGDEANKLLKELQEDFGEYINILSPEILNRILKMQDKLLNLKNL